MGESLCDRAGFLLGADQLHRGRRGRRAIPRGGRRGVCAGRRRWRTHGGDACRFPRHAVGAALGRAATRPTHRGDSRRTPKRDLYRLRQYCHAVRVTVELEAVARPDVDLTDGTFYVPRESAGEARMTAMTRRVLQRLPDLRLATDDALPL